MITTINNRTIDLSKPIDISIPITNDEHNPIAWYQKAPEINPVVMGDWIGKVAAGQSSTNFNNLVFNPHAHGTHTECLGHITKEFYSLNQCLKRFFFWATLVSVQPKKVGEDLVISKAQIEKEFKFFQHSEIKPEAIVIRTLPNELSKKSFKYSNTNPPFLSEEAALFLYESGIQHLLIDLPSVDKEKDGGKLAAHKAFWNVKDVNHLNEDARLDCTITEMVYVPNEVSDGSYVLNLQIASFENDASPSKPVLYAIQKNNPIY
jgi:kynurenine formamidase